MAARHAPAPNHKQIISAHVNLDTSCKQMQLDKQRLRDAERRLAGIDASTLSHADLATQDAITYLQDSHRHQKAKFEDAVKQVSRALEEAAQALGVAPASPHRAASIAALASQAAEECPELARKVVSLCPAPPPPPSVAVAVVIDLTADD